MCARGLQLGPALEPPMSCDPFGLVGTTIAGRYAVEEVVGEGGSSLVYRARHTLWDRHVAIKAFRGFECADLEVRERLLRAFLQEGAILAQLSERTTAIVQARDTATLVTATGEWVPFLVLEWLEGDTLEAALWHERRARLPPRSIGAAVALLEPIAHALAVAHAQGICHRDLKPGNVFVTGDARRKCTVKLLDFGLASFFCDARRTLSERRRPVAAAGFTPSYGAPEQFSQAYGITGPWTDVYALALILVELVAGRQPMGNGPPEQIALGATDSGRRPTPKSFGVVVPDAVERVLARALAVYPAERWQTAGSFWSALRAAIASRDAEPPVAPPPAVRVPAALVPPARGRPRAAPAVALLLALALAACAASDHRVSSETWPQAVALER
jgi:serine/threonine protein kinase